MKNILISFFVGAVLLFGSCSDFLDTMPPTSITPEVAIQNMEDAQSVIYGIYNYMQSTNSYNHSLIIYGDIRADDIQSDNINNGAYNYYIYNHKSNPSNALWLNPMQISRNASRIIESIDEEKVTDGTEVQRNNVKGHAIALRALAHFNQLIVYSYPFAKDQGKSWGAIIIDHVLNVDEKPVRSTVDESFRFITEELERAIPIMSREKNSYNMMNAYGARALLARAYLYWEKNDKAFETASSLIEELKSSGNVPYRLYTRDEYLGAFAYNSTGTNLDPESLLEIFNTPADNPARNGIGYMYHRRGYNAYMVTESFQNLIQADPNDIRNSLIEMASTDLGDRPYLIKYAGQDNGEAAFDNNVPVIRLSEVYLIAAEAAVKDNNGGNRVKGLEYLNNIVQRANPENSVSDAEYTLDRVLEERRKELIGEGHRFFDLLRNGKKYRREGGYHKDNAVSVGEISWDYPYSILGIPLNEFLLNPEMERLDQQNPEYGYGI